MPASPPDPGGSEPTKDPLNLGSRRVRNRHLRDGESDGGMMGERGERRREEERGRRTPPYSEDKCASVVRVG